MFHGFWKEGVLNCRTKWHICNFLNQIFFLRDSYFSYSLFFFKIILYLFIYFWLCWVLASARGPSPAAASGGHSSSRCAGLSLSRPLLLRSTSSRCAGPAAVAHGPSRSAAWRIFPDQGSNPCPLHCQADSQPLRHQGSPKFSNHIIHICTLIHALL